MDDYDLLLMDPIVGLEDSPYEDIAPSPDMFRLHPFGNPDIIKGKWDSYSMERCSKESGLDLRFWLDSKEFLPRIKELLLELREVSNDNFIQDILERGPDLDLATSKTFQIYSEMYTYLDVLAIKCLMASAFAAWKDFHLSNIIDDLPSFRLSDRLIDPAKVIAIRSGIYSLYILTLIDFKSTTKRIKKPSVMIMEKMIEFEADPKVSFYFTSKEIEDYKAFAERY